MLCRGKTHGIGGRKVVGMEAMDVRCKEIVVIEKKQRLKNLNRRELNRRELCYRT